MGRACFDEDECLLRLGIQEPKPGFDDVIYEQFMDP